MGSRRVGWLSALFIAACVVEPTDSGGKDSVGEDTAADTAGACNDGMTKEEWIEAWDLAFCTWAVACERPSYGDSMERCYELSRGKDDRCIDECRAADALAAMQAHEASGSCESAPPEAAVPFCEE